jgi:hypothetical protein
MHCAALAPKIASIRVGFVLEACRCSLVHKKLKRTDEEDLTRVFDFKTHYLSFRCLTISAGEC